MTEAPKPKEIIEAARREGRRKLLEHEALSLVKAYGVPVPEFRLAKSVEEAVKAAKEIGFPLVLKVVSPDIVHKSDVGGVILNVNTEEEVVKAFNTIMTNVPKKAPGARIVGVLVQRMAPEGLEVIVGATRDPVFGPVVMFGLGGVFVEVLRDVSFRVAPVDENEAMEMIREVKGYKLLQGYRNMPPRDVEALKRIIVAVSKLMMDLEEVSEMDLNPIMSYEAGKGAVAVDVRVILSSK